MTREDLDALHRLYLVDKAMHDLQVEASGLDTGKEVLAKAKALLAKEKAAIAHAHELHGELKSLELEQKSLEEKAERENKRLFGGDVVSPKEIQALEADIKSLKERASSMDEKILALMEEVPQAEKEAKSVSERLAQIKKELAGIQSVAKERHGEIKQRYGIRKSERVTLVSGVPTELLEEYEERRKKHGDVGMAEVQPDGSCSECHVAVNARAIEKAKMGSIEHCEGCGRIVYPESQVAAAE